MFTLLLVLIACDSGTPAPAASPSPAPAAASTGTEAAPAGPSITGVVQETLAAGSYTYVRAKPASGEDVWAAVTGAGPAMGSTVTIATGLAMKDFHSDTLNRDFPLVYFVQTLGGDSAGAASAPLSTMPAGHPSTGADAAPAAPSAPAPTAVTGPPAGARKVAEVWAQRADLKGREVTLSGKVVKSTHGVLGHNWLHLQDGSGASGDNDLTLTTNDSAEIGDQITAKGVVAIDQDFGSGYTYPVMITDAAVTVTTPAPK